MPSTGGTVLDVGAVGVEPVWSPQADLLIVRSGSVLSMVDPFSGSATPLPTAGFDDGPEWSPAGGEVAVQTGSGAGIVAVPGGSLSTLACADPDATGCEGEWPTWSPSGSEIAFEDGIDILVVPRPGGSARLVFNDGHDASLPRWSPDGRWVAFVREKSPGSDAHLWVVDARGQAFNAGAVIDGSGHDERPNWTPSSDALFFGSGRSGSAQIWKVAFTPPVPAAGRSFGELKAGWRP